MRKVILAATFCCAIFLLSQSAKADTLTIGNVACTAVDLSGYCTAMTVQNYTDRSWGVLDVHATPPDNGGVGGGSFIVAPGSTTYTLSSSLGPYTSISAGISIYYPLNGNTLIQVGGLFYQPTGFNLGIISLTGQGGNPITLGDAADIQIQAQMVPEPATALLLVTGLAVSIRRRRNNF